jgi:transaldolase / glucose-6-phosphate isomerase
MFATKSKDEAVVNPLLALHDEGQAVWLDFLSRRFLADGGLERLVKEDGLTGVTSNPSIFEKAIAESEDYDASLQSVGEGSDLDVMALYERLAIDDIRQAADDLRAVYEKSDGADGYVSIEVSPYLAMDTQATIAEARRLVKAVNRPNLMVKVPATKPGLPAIRRLTGEGINVNITLLFSQRVYEDVVEAYLGGLEDYAAQGGDLHDVSSVASFFVSRIDVAIDDIAEGKTPSTQDTDKRQLKSLRGRVAIANAKLAYQRFKRLFSGARWQKLVAKGARVQRVLWASTSTKTAGLSDVLYVEQLIGRDTINTMPPGTIDAFRDHGHVGQNLEKDFAEAERTMKILSQCGISIDAVTDKLTEEGVKQFCDAFDKLLGALSSKRTHLLGGELNGQSIKLPPDIHKSVNATLDAWRRRGNIRRLWAGDAALWTGGDEGDWVGWLNIVEKQRKRLGILKQFADDVRNEGFTVAVLLGMGGSSLGSEVLAKTFGRAHGYPGLTVLDSTDPEQIHAVEATIDVAKTLFIVSSKSGSTLEPNVLKDYFFERVAEAIGRKRAGSHFIAITDPGSKLQMDAKNHHFRRIAFGVPSIGGRYSVLSDFGMIPAAITGLEIGGLLEATQIMVNSCGAAVPPAQNPGVVLGTVLAEAARTGRNKVTIIASPQIAQFGAWLEQLLAESTGKQGRGMIPVDTEPVTTPEKYGNDRLFAYIRLMGQSDQTQDDGVAAIERAGSPVIRIDVSDRYAIGQEFFRWEMATAVAGAIIAINPFDQPDVEASKEKTRALTDAYEKGRALPAERPVLKENGIALYAEDECANIITRAPNGTTLAGSLKAYLGQLRSGDYCALLAYIARDSAHERALQDMRVAIRDAKRVATCVGFGPRFLHSTGQAYKGGPNTGVFLELTCDARHDVQIPGHRLSFGAVIAAQARGDFSVLNERKRRAIRVHLGTDVEAGLEHLKTALRQALV